MAEMIPTETSMNGEAEMQDKWEEMDFPALSKRRAEIMKAIRTGVEDLLAIDPLLKEKASDIGLQVEVDYAQVEQSLSKLVGGRGGAAAAERGGRGRSGGRPERYQLIWRKSGEPVLNEEKQPIVFKSRVKKLRGPRYERLLGNKVKDVALVDTQQDDQVVVDQLELAPAPGGRRGG